MKTCWIDDKRLQTILERHEAYWQNTLKDGPILWMVVPDAHPRAPLAPPATPEQAMTDIDYVVAAIDDYHARAHFAVDAIPIHNPWLGPDQFAGWLGAALTFRPDDNTSWVAPFVKDWAHHDEFKIDPANRWWNLYLALLERSVAAGKGKWATAFPDLHTGIDALSAIRGPERLLEDLLTQPDEIRCVMRQMTGLFKQVVDVVWEVLEKSGQGTTNWCGGWSGKRYLCIGQNDFTCMISPAMFDEFCLEDTVETVNHVDYALYHLDGPGALRHLPRILEIERLHTVQWIHGDGQPPHSKWLHVLRQIQDAGKSIQIWYNLHYTRDVVDLEEEVKILCNKLDPTRLFIAAEVPTIEQAEALAANVIR